MPLWMTGPPLFTSIGAYGNHLKSTADHPCKALKTQ